jgi:ParB family chromosome partitioning protein
MLNNTNESQNKKQRLGRGLGSLLSPQESTPVISAPTQPLIPDIPVDSEKKIWSVPVEKLQPSQFQPRTVFNKETLEELAQSIRRNGILQPIVARRIDNNKLAIIAGERRWRAAQIAGLLEVPVILRTLKNQEAMEIALIENIQREDLNPLDEAEAYNKLITDFSLTQQQVADKVGKDRATVANSVRLLGLEKPVQALIRSGELMTGHAKVLLSVQDSKQQVELARAAVAQKLSVRELEKRAKNPPPLSDLTNSQVLDQNVTEKLIHGLSSEIQKLFGTKVNIEYNAGKGRVSIQFYSDDELTNLVERFRKGCLK